MSCRFAWIEYDEKNQALWLCNVPSNMPRIYYEDPSQWISLICEDDHYKVVVFNLAKSYSSNITMRGDLLHTFSQFNVVTDINLI